MKIEKSTATKLVISELESLDPVTVFLEDFEPGKGKITVSCWGKSWTGYWGGMGKDRTVAKFFCDCSDDYIIGYFAPQMRGSQFSGEALQVMARKSIIKRRRGRCFDFGDLGKQEARELWDETECFPGFDSLNQLPGDAMTGLFGDEWWYSADSATEPNPDYQYLGRIIQAVQKALREAQ